MKMLNLMVTDTVEWNVWDKPLRDAVSGAMYGAVSEAGAGAGAVYEAVTDTFKNDPDYPNLDRYVQEAEA